MERLCRNNGGEDRQAASEALELRLFGEGSQMSLSSEMMCECHRSA
jgi:hypothetical protein